MQKLINEDMKVLDALGEEILNETNFSLSDFNDLRDKLKAACDEHYEAEMKYHNILRELIAETAKRIDDKVCP
jgi:hypothetical protein